MRFMTILVRNSYTRRGDRMVLLLLSAGLASLACLTTLAIGALSPVGKALGVLSAVLGIACGVTGGSVAAGLGADERTVAAVGLFCCSSLMIVGSVVARRLIRKAELQRHL